jgi:hypothetical protein
MASLENANIPVIKFDEVGVPPSTPTTGDWKIYFTAAGLFVIDDTGAELGPLGVAQNGNRVAVISPSQLIANQNDWNPTNLATAAEIRLSTDAARDLTGITAQPSRTRLTLLNVGGFNCVLKHDVTSTAANRFLCPGSADFTLTPNQAVDIWYDTTSSRWRVIG